jgi:hypothetical protein
LTGAGSFDRADCTRCSRRCICAVRLLIWVSEVELGKPRVAGAFVLVFRMTDGVAVRFRVELIGGCAGPLELRRFVDTYRAEGFGVVLESPEGSCNLVFGGFIGVFTSGLAVAEASDIGGEGGVGVSRSVSVVDTDFVSGGVVIIGEDAVELGEPGPSKAGEFGAVISVDNEGIWRFRSLSCIISASIFKSESSSRNRWVSIRRFSLSCSPTLISSSIITARSIATLYLDSRSSSDEEVFRAWRSKSSFATSISRSLSWRVRFKSRSVVISFCRTFCAEAASVLDCLYFV